MSEVECKCSIFTIVNGVLVCSACNSPSSSAKWQANVYGKEIEQSQVENKGRIFPPESKRLAKRLV